MFAVNQIERSPHLRKIVWLCVLIVACLGFVQAVHVHDVLPAQNRSHCSLCIVAHNGAVVTATSTGPVPIIHSNTVAIPEQQLQPQLQVPSAFIRPPPQSL